MQLDRLRFLLLAGLTTTALACSLTVDWEGFREDATRVDASADASPAGDGATFSVPDASVDPADAGDGCRGETFRDDFEGETTGYSVAKEGASSIERSSVRARTGEKSLRVSLGSGDGAAGVWRRSFGAPKRIRYCYFLWLDAGKSDRTINVGNIDFRNPAERLFVAFSSLQRENMVFAGQEITPGDSYKSFSSRPAIAERWTKVVFDIDLSTAPGTLTASYDGVTTVDREPFQQPLTTENVTIAFGVGYASAGSPRVLYVDDVTVDVIP